MNSHSINIHFGPVQTCFTFTPVVSHEIIINVRWQSSSIMSFFLSHKNREIKNLTNQFLGDLDDNKREEVEASADYDCWDGVVDKALVVFGWYEGCFQCVCKLKEPMRDLKQSNQTPISFFLSFFGFQFNCESVVTEFAYSDVNGSCEHEVQQWVFRD